MVNKVVYINTYTRIVRLGSSLSASHNTINLVQGERPTFQVE